LDRLPPNVVLGFSKVSLPKQICSPPQEAAYPTRSGLLQLKLPARSGRPPLNQAPAFGQISTMLFPSSPTTCTTTLLAARIGQVYQSALPTPLPFFY
jgi:hypothetical protein